MKTLTTLRDETLYRLGDTPQQVWTADEVDLHLRNAYQQIAQLKVFWDVTYAENVPTGFTMTQPWEDRYVDTIGGYRLAVANYTTADEFGLADDERTQLGPGSYTSGFELTDGAVARLGITDISATATLPATLVALERVTWDKRGIDAMDARRLSRVDARYEITKGEVYGFIWEKDGVRTLRKVRVPAAVADLVQPTGTWGLLRRTTDLRSETPTGTWGIPRRIPGQCPMGPTQWGTPRRVYLEGKNVRVEHARQGRPLEQGSELPDRYAGYLRDYAQWQCLKRPGPGFDAALAAHFQQRWERGVARIERRLASADREHVAVLGGDDRPLLRRPPRPRLPWPYGSVVR